MTLPPAGWVADPTERHEHRYWDGSQWTDHVSNGGVTGSDKLMRPPAPLRPDNWLAHFLLFLLISMSMIALASLLVGFVWLAFAMGATGRRKRDILMMPIPIWGTIVFIQTVWRYTAKNVYWSVRADRVSNTPFSG